MLSQVFSAYRLKSLIGPAASTALVAATGTVFSAYRLKSLIGRLAKALQEIRAERESSAPIGLSR